jgi:hypothetical protein
MQLPHAAQVPYRSACTGRPMVIRRPTFPEVLLQAILGAVICLFVVDLTATWRAQCELLPASEYCHVWGASEGPSGGLWNYRSQSVYLLSAVAWIGTLSSAALSPFLATSAFGGIGLLLAIATLGSLALELLGRLLFLS